MQPVKKKITIKFYIKFSKIFKEHFLTLKFNVNFGFIRIGCDKF